MKLIVGLGNPGRAYAHTRHNVGFDVIDILSKRHRIRVSRRAANALIGQGVIAGDEVTLAKPMTFMNLSGQAVAELARRLNVHSANVLVIYDDVNLPLGKIRIRLKGSAGGHNGMKSIIEKLHTQEFPRLRIGIGVRGNMVDHVLSRFSRRDQAAIQPAMEDAADAVEMMLTEGMEAAMNRYNRSETDE